MENQIIKKNKIEVSKIFDMRSKLRKGDYKIIHQMVRGAYKLDTIYKMFSGLRTMNPGVFQQAEILTSTIDNLINQADENQSDTI